MSPRHVHMSDGEERIEETAVEARQGYRDLPVWFVLVISTTLVVLIFTGLWLIFAGQNDDRGPAAEAPPEAPSSALEAPAQH